MPRNRRDLLFLALLLGHGAARLFASEPACYRTEADAIARTGPRAAVGFRLAAIQRDAFSGIVWALVADCAHPERPGFLSIAPTAAPAAASGASLPASTPQTPARPLILQAGTRVRLVAIDGAARIETAAIAQTSAAVGDRIRVRLLPPGATEGPERFAEATVRSETLVESEAR